MKPEPVAVGDCLKKRWNPEIDGEENLKIEIKLAQENQQMVKFNTLLLLLCE